MPITFHNLFYEVHGIFQATFAADLSAQARCFFLHGRVTGNFFKGGSQVFCC